MFNFQSNIFHMPSLIRSCILKKIYNWLPNVFKLEGYSFNINADHRVFPEAKCSQKRASDEEVRRRIFINKTVKTVKHTDHILIFFVTGSISFKTVFFDRKKDYKLCGRLSFVDLSTVNLMNFVLLNIT